MKKKTAKKKTAKKSVAKVETTTATINVEGTVVSVASRIKELQDKLKASKGDAAEGKRIRAKLRKLGHDGGLRNRTWTNRKTGEKVHVNK